MAITRQEVAHVAALARLKLSEADLDRFAGQLDKILTHIAKLNELDTADVPPTAHALAAVKNVWRADEVWDGLDRERALANAPDRRGGFFAVPRVLEEGDR